MTKKITKLMLNGDEYQIREYQQQGWQPGADTFIYMPLNSTDQATDLMGNLTSNENVTFGTYGGVDCGSFNGSNGKIYITNTLDVPSTLTGLVWCYPITNPVNPDGHIIEIGNVFCLSIMNGFNGFFFNPVQGNDLQNDTQISVNQWYLVMVSIDASNTTLYVRGTGYDKYATGTTTYTGGPSIETAIGGNRNSGYNRYFNGYLSEVIIEEGAWSAQDFDNYYNQTKANYGIS